METNIFLRNLIITGLFAALFIPLIVSTSLFFPFITGKAFFFRFIVEIIFSAWILLALRDSGYAPKKSWISILMVVFVAVVAAADIFGINPGKSIWSNYERMEGLVAILHIAAYFFVAAHTLTERLWIRYFNTGIAVSTILCLYGLFQLAGKIAINQGGLRLDATLGNAIYFAGFLLVNIFISIFLLARHRSKGMRYLYGVLILLHVVILYYTATRGAVLGLVGGILLSSLIILVWGKTWDVYRKAALGMVGVVALLVVMFFAFRNTDVVRKDPVLSRFASISVSETKTQARGYIWPMAWQGFKERPILGWGQENFNIIFNKYYNPHMDQEQWFDRTHNIVLDWLVAAGLLGALSYLSLFAAVFVLIWKRSSLIFVEKSILTGLFAAYFFHNMFVFDNLVSYLFFASFLAYVHHTSKPEPIRIFSRLASYDALKKSAPGALAAILILLLVWVNWRPYFANRALIQAIQPQQASIESNLALFKKALAYNAFGNQEIREQLFQRALMVAGSGGSDVAKQEFLLFTKNELDKQIAVAPRDARAYYFQGSYLAAFRLYNEAIPHFEKALELSPHKQPILSSLGEGYLNSGNEKKALELLKYSYELAPENSKAAKSYVLTSIYLKQPNASELVAKAYVPKGIPGDPRIEYDVELARAYFQVKNIAKASEVLGVIVSRDPSVKNYVEWANIYSTTGQGQKAMEILRKALADNPASRVELESHIEKLRAGGY